MNNILEYDQYGKNVYKPNLDWPDNSQRKDIIVYKETIHAEEVKKNLNFDLLVDTNTQDSVTSIIHEFWGCFIK